MYLAPLKTLLVEAVKRTFDDEYPVAEWRNVKVGIEYPIDPQDYPGIWVDYDDTDALKIAGVGQIEFAETSGGPVPFTRWKFTGYASYTVVALSSFERDRLYDELVRVLAFGLLNQGTEDFRKTIEDNEFIATNIDFDTIQPRGNNAAPGTPWGTDEIIYERTLNLNVIGEFIPDNETGALLRLSAIKIVEERHYYEDSTGTLFPEDPPYSGLVDDWH